MASGTLRKRYKRQSTGAWEWEAAQAIVEGWERSGTWGKIDPLPQAPQVSEYGAERVTIEQATQAFLDRISTKGFELVTESKYRTFMKQLRSR